MLAETTPIPTFPLKGKEKNIAASQGEAPKIFMHLKGEASKIFPAPKKRSPKYSLPFKEG